MVAYGEVLRIRGDGHKVLLPAVERNWGMRFAWFHGHADSQVRLGESVRITAPDFFGGLVNFRAIGSQPQVKSERIVGGFQLQFHFAPERVESGDLV